MPHSLTLQINLENFKFFKYKFFRFLLSPAQKNLMQNLKRIHEDLSRLKKPTLYLTENNENHIGRGDTYAITKTLEEKLERDRIRLNNLHAAFKQKNINLNDLTAALDLETNNLEALHESLKQKSINLDDLYAVINQKEIRLENLSKALKPKKITLEDIVEALENNYHINNKEILSAILLCLVEPIWVHGNLSVFVLSFLSPFDYFCSNLSEYKGPRKSKLRVETNTDSNSIEFCLNLYIISTDVDKIEYPANDNSKLIEGSVDLFFSLEKTTPAQVKLLPITMQFNFSDEQKSKKFQEKLTKNFKNWLFHENESDYIPIKLEQWRAIQIDFWVFPILIGLLVGLSAMVSFIVLSLTPVSPLLLPPLGLALGLCLASVMNAYAQINIKKEQSKPQRPIHLLNKKSTQDPGFFNHPAPHNSSTTAETKFIFNNR